MGNSPVNPETISVLITVLRKKFDHILQKRRVNVFDNPRPNRKFPVWYNTTGVYVVVDGTEYKVTKKTLRNRGILTSTGEIFILEQIQDCYVYEWPNLNLNQYKVGIYRNSLGNGWYSNTCLYLYEGKYYADLN